jgi:hypothetical protein
VERRPADHAGFAIADHPCCALLKHTDFVDDLFHELQCISHTAPILMGQDLRRGRIAPTGIMRKMRPTPVGGCMRHRTGAMLDAACGLRRTPLLGRWANSERPAGEDETAGPISNRPEPTRILACAHLGLRASSSRRLLSKAPTIHQYYPDVFEEHVREIRNLTSNRAGD